MSARDYEEAVALMRRYPDRMGFVGPRAESLVAAAEAALGVTFPPTYRRFLREHGAGGFGAEEVYGVVHDDFEDSAVPDGVWFTLTERRDGDLPPTLVVVYAEGTGELFCLDLEGADAGDEAPVVTHESGAGPIQPKETVAEDFGALLLDLVRQEVHDAQQDEEP